MKLRIFHKILVTMLIVAVIPLFAIWYVNYLDSSRYLNENVEQQLSGTAARLVLAVDLIGQAVSVEVDAADVRPY